MAGKYPDRVAVGVAEACGTDISGVAAALRIPILHHNGKSDMCYNDDLFRNGRSKGALWAHAVNPNPAWVTAPTAFPVDVEGQVTVSLEIGGGKDPGRTGGVVPSPGGKWFQSWIFCAGPGGCPVEAAPGRTEFYDLRGHRLGSLVSNQGKRLDPSALPGGNGVRSASPFRPIFPVPKNP